MFRIIICLLVLVFHSEAGITLESDMVVRRVKSIVCRTDINLSRFPGQIEIYHQWNQVYAGKINYSVSNIPPMKAINTMFTITLEKFDNNTNIYNSFSAYNASNRFHHVLNLSMGCSGNEKKNIRLFNDQYYEYHIESIVTYVDSLTFSCQQYSQKSNKYIQIGWINTLGNRIITYNQSEITMTMKEAHNGSMLCCLYYLTYAKKNATRIQRYVENKTLLIYHKEWTNAGRQDNSSDVDTSTEISKPGKNSNIPDTTNSTRSISDTSNAIGKNSETTNATGKKSDTTNAKGQKLDTTKYAKGRKSDTIDRIVQKSDNTNAKSQKSDTTNPTGENSDITNTTDQKSDTTNATDQKSNSGNATDQKSNTTNAIGKKSDISNITDTSDHVSDADVVIISSISTIVLILLVVIAIIKKRCWTNPNQPERPQLPIPNDPDNHTPFYLNLLFRRECEREMEAEAQNYYEEIVYD